MHTIKDNVISKLGGVGVVADICGITPGAVSQWEIIPARHQSAILADARARGIDLSPEEIINGKKPKRNGKTNGHT